MIVIQTLTNLLSQVEALSQHYKKISQLSGDNFNVFRILKLESSEVRMHSAFLAELLNPQGSHGQGAIFLKLFVNEFCFKGNDLDADSCKVEVEKHTGFINEAGTYGGRIDIIVTDRYNNHIIIENKIYAGDQNYQLLRYATHSHMADLFYLTLEGNEPSPQSKADLVANEDYKCISYKTDISTWLEKCRKEMAVTPIIRESITQYLNLVKYLINQTTNDNMKKDLSSIIASNLEASFLISDNLKDTLSGLMKKFDHDLNVIADEFDMKYSNGVNFEKNYTGFWFYSSEWKFANIGFQFHSYNKKLIYGITAKKDPDAFPSDLRSAIHKAAGFNSKHNGWWPAYMTMEEPYDNWAKYPAWKAIEDGQMCDKFRERIKYLRAVLQDVKL